MLILFESMIIGISPKDSPGVNVLSFRRGFSILSVGKYKLHDPLYS